MAKETLTIEELENKKDASQKTIEINRSDLLLKDNRDADKLDGRLLERSEDNYMQIAKDIVDTSAQQLKTQNVSKNELKKLFTRFFIGFLSAQYLVLVFHLVLKALWRDMNLSDTVLITYITSVFVETLGAVAIMIKYAFSSDQEVKILQILNDVISSYKKFKDK